MEIEKNKFKLTFMDHIYPSSPPETRMWHKGKEIQSITAGFNSEFPFF